MSNFCIALLTTWLAWAIGLAYFYWRDVMVPAKAIAAAFPPHPQTDDTADYDAWAKGEKNLQRLKDHFAAIDRLHETETEAPLTGYADAPNSDDREYKHWVPTVVDIGPSVDAYSDGCKDGEKTGIAIGRAQAYAVIIDLICDRATRVDKPKVEADECLAIAYAIRAEFKNVD